MKQTGELLKQAREGAKLSLSEVALATKINPKILNAIEHGDLSNLPAKTFLKGFIRSYALYLKMDTDLVMKTFNAETGDQPPPQIDKEVIRQAAETAAAAKEEKAPKRRVNDDESFSGLRAIAVIVIVVLIGLIIGVRELIEKYQKETVVAENTEIKATPLPPKEPEKAPEKPPEDVKAAEVKAEEKKEEPKKEEPVAKAEPAQPAEPAKVEPPPAKVEAPALLKAVEQKVVANAPTPAVKPAEVVKAPPPQPPAQPAPASTTAATPAPTSVAPSAALKAAKHEIILEALDKVEVKFQVRGETKRLSLAPSQVHTIFADEPTTLDISDGGAVNIILNGRDKGPAGDLGKPKQVKIP